MPTANDALSAEQIRAWLKEKLGPPPGKIVYAGRNGRTIPSSALCRAVGCTRDTLSSIRRARNPTVSEKTRIAFTRVIRLWEAGEIDFGGGGNERRLMQHVEKPKPMPMRFALDWNGETPKLMRVARLTPAPRLPKIRIESLTKRVSKQ